MILPTGSKNPMAAMRKHTYGRQRGFSLIEVIVSVVILSFSSVFLYHAFFSSLSALSHMHNRFLADSLISDLAYTTKTKLTEERTYHFTNQEDTRTLENRPFAYSIAVEQESALTNLYHVIIIVRWKENFKMVTIRREQLINVGA